MFTIASAVFCTDPGTPDPIVELVALSRDSVALQFRDSTFELTASPRGALGVELNADVTWRSKDSRILLLVPNGRKARLVPVRSGTTEVEAVAGDRVGTARVFVLDTVFSVQLTSPDTLVTMGQSLPFTATVLGPPGASREVVWSVTNPAVGSIDPNRGNNPVFIVSRDTGSTDIIATAADRKKFASARLRTARPVSLQFESQPGQTTAPIRANDVLIPGPVVIARDALGNVFPGPVPVALSITPGTGNPGALLFGTPVLTTSSSQAKFDNVGVDGTGSGYLLTASSPGLTPANSSAFTAGSECPGTSYVFGTLVTGTLTTASCQSRASEYYDRFITTSAVQRFLTIKVPLPFRHTIVFPEELGSRTPPPTVFL